MGIGDWISENILGSKNTYKAQSRQVDAGGYMYGGEPGKARADAARYRGQAEGAQNRAGVNVDYGQADQDRMLGMQARAGQNTLAQAMQQRALGQTPSIAQMQGDRQMQQAQAAQASQAASARGAGGMAAAQRNAANNIANAQGAISGQVQVNAAQERMQAEQAAFGAHSNMRQGDMASQGQSAQQSQYQAQLADTQRSRNDQMTSQMTQNEMGVNNAQLGARMNYESQQSANDAGAAGINAGVSGQNAGASGAAAMAGLGAAGNVVGGFASMGSPAPKPRKDGGPITPGQPYLVGEEGPEVVVPAQGGTVIPAGPTKKLLGASDVALSTWGTGKGVSKAQADVAVDRNEDAGNAVVSSNQNRDARAPSTGGFALPGGDNMADPVSGQRMTLAQPLVQADRDTVALAKAQQAEGVDLDEETERKAGGAASRLGKSQKTLRGTLASGLSSAGNGLLESAGKFDTAYHGPQGGFQAPHLIPLPDMPRRAMGGPVAGGMPFLGGEQGPELVVPQFGGAGMRPPQGASSPPGAAVNLSGAGMSGGDVKAALTGLGGGGIPGTVGGGGITGGAVNLGGVPGYAHGGAMPGRQPAIVGEQGPELVVPDDDPLLSRQPVTLASAMRGRR